MSDLSDTRSTLLTRRRVLTLSGVAILAASYGASRYALRPAKVGSLVTPAEARDLSLNGQALLVDIRRPDEWQRTGIGDTARPLDMRRDDFTAALAELVGQERDAPIILICAGGVRSRILSDRLTKAGFTRIIDVPEGMMGSRAGPGWIRGGLPTVPWQEN